MSRRAFDRAAPGYDEHAALQRRSATACARFLFAHAPAAPQRAIVDVAGGTGLVARALVAEGWRGGIVGLDRAPGMCRVARAHGLGVVQADAAALPLRSGLAAGVAVSWSAHWFERPQDALGECARILAPGAPLIMVVPVHGTLERWRMALADAGWSRPVDPVFESVETWRARLLEAGFEVVLDAQERCELDLESAHGLLRHLRELGAGGESPSLRSPGDMRAVLSAVRALERRGTFAAEFEIATLGARRGQRSR